MDAAEHTANLIRLKALELVGYKTFAMRTLFCFDGGITAIVGPNGSGKSNVADAVRWVLGEQSFSLLRAKRGEDMIFSGSERRARMGMAEATITLDNSDGWLDIDFAEVAITRRAHRSGENEYLLNGNRVRLRDIADLLGKSGLSKRTYTVIGQGLVDAALSLRPQERRALIEEAAGLTLYQSRRADALSKLDATRANVLRVHDLINEISPRLRRLRQQAERAEEHALVRGELEQTLRIWYSYQWKRGQEELGRVRTVEAYQRRQLETQRQRVSELAARASALRARQGELRARLGRWHRESSALHAQSEARQRDLAVAEERRRLLVQSRDELLDELGPLESGLEAQVAEVRAAEAELAALEEIAAEQRDQVSAAQAAVEARRAQVASLVSAQATAREDLLDLRTRIADHDSRLTQFDERRRELLDGREAHAAAAAELGSRIAEARTRWEALSAGAAAVSAAVEEAGARMAQIESQLAQSEACQREAREASDELNRQLGRLQDRQELLERLHDEGVGLYDGVRNVLRAARPASPPKSSRLDGVLGTVGELIEVPRELETAIEAALGGQLQDVVVERWADAQRAIEHLKKTGGGRATFLPLDTLRPARPIRAPSFSGVIGVASELVGSRPGVEPVVDHLLGRTIVCRDLEAARRVLDAVRGSYQIVTPSGEVARSSGAVTGGTRRRQRKGGILARERERRELPACIEEVQARLREVGERIQNEAAHEAELRRTLDAVRTERKELQDRLATLARERLQVEQRLDQAERERDWHRSLADSSDRELLTLDQREAELRDRLSELGARASRIEGDLVALQARIEQMEDRDLEAQLAAWRARQAETLQQQAGRQARLDALRSSLRRSEAQIAQRRRRADEIAAQLGQTEVQIAELQESEAALQVEIRRYAEQIEPAERELQDLEAEQLELQERESRARTRLQDLEERHGRTQVEVVRHDDHMASLRRRIKEELGLVELDMGDDLSGQPFLPLNGLVSSLPEVKVLPEGLEEQISSLRRHLRRLEPVNPDAPAEYAEISQRHAFLTEQAGDLERASAQLWEVIAELDAVMEREFKRTFTAVSREFRRYFAELFGGGSARLELTDPDDLMTTGIDIIARPPGKRQQGLALLSGGERALTTAALIFAILTVSPTPFCVLDEMDAALDEANVGRFRTVLKSLSANTQFVVITHNRYTVEVADTIYGISMGTDGVSCVISHQLRD